MLELNNVSKKFPVKRGLFGIKSGSLVYAVDGISLKISPSETLGIVGESGCGKSTLVHLIIRLLQPTNGSISYNGLDINDSSVTSKELSKKIQFVFQEAYSSLNPRMSIYNLLSEPIEIHGISKGTEKDKYIFKLLKLIGLKKHHLLRYPHQLSGGERQRVALARALAIEPEFIILDEPVSGLDASIKSQILKLLIDLKQIHRALSLATVILMENFYICELLNSLSASFATVRASSC